MYILDSNESPPFAKRIYTRTLGMHTAPLLEILPLGGVLLLRVGYYVTVLVRLGVEHLLFPLCGRHLRRVLFPPLGPPVLEPDL